MTAYASGGVVHGGRSVVLDAHDVVQPAGSPLAARALLMVACPWCWLPRLGADQ